MLGGHRSDETNAGRSGHSFSQKVEITRRPMPRLCIHPRQQTARRPKSQHQFLNRKEARVLRRSTGTERHQLDEAHRHSPARREVNERKIILLIHSAQQHAVELDHLESFPGGGIDPPEHPV